MSTDRAVQVARIHGERDLAAHAADGSALLAEVRRARLANLKVWLLTLPDGDISDSARRDGLALIAGADREPGRE